jgi:hypothetical protein
MNLVSLFLTAITLASTIIQTRSLQPPCLATSSDARLRTEQGTLLSRRLAIATTALTTAQFLGSSSATTTLPSAHAAVTANGLTLTTAPKSGLKWADAKMGTGPPPVVGDTVAIDYAMASTAGRFPQIYTTKDSGAPYRWQLGDGSTIVGMERAILGDLNDQLPPMRPGGIRRVIIPAELGYLQLKNQSNNAQCSTAGVGPIPPKDGTGAYQRWVQFYCNPRIPYQPDLVVDIKLYGPRT